MFAEQRPTMTIEEFLAWEELQEEKHELIDGRPVLRRLRKWPDETEAMSGGTRRHSMVAANVITALNVHLRGGPCRALSSDMKVRSATGRVRYPDVTVDCSPVDRATEDALIAPDPRVIVEVLSPSNRLRDQVQMVEDYQAVAGVVQIVFIDRRTTEIVTWTRGDDGWTWTAVEGREAVLELPSIDVILPLGEIFEGLEVAAYDAPA